MHIIIDSYNVLHAGTNIQKKLTKQQFIKKIITYHQKRGHAIVLVFDAGDSPYETEIYEAGITIIHSGQYQTADVAIIRYIKEKLNNKETLLVSSDNELCKAAQQYNVSSIDSELFFTIMTQRINEKHQVEKPHYKKRVIKYSDEKNDFIDALMSASVLDGKDNILNVEEYLLKNVSKKSKMDKTMMTILNKL